MNHLTAIYQRKMALYGRWCRLAVHWRAMPALARYDAVAFYEGAAAGALHVALFYLQVIRKMHNADR